MKQNLKHLKLFEAFESDILSKTLGYIERGRDREEFLDKIKRVCNYIDLPYSKITDEFFEYLPFSAALHKSDTITDEDCTATSEETFPDFAVSGEVCTDGRMKRMWGDRTRMVTCPACGGTGIKPKTGEPKLLKFWFTKDGNYVTTTCVDGIVRSNEVSGRLSEKDSDYQEVRALNHREVKALQTGEYVKIQLNGRWTYGYIIKQGRQVFVIQNSVSGGSPRTSFRHIASYSWLLEYNSDYGSAILVNRVSEEDKISAPDPYDWNTGVRFERRGVRVYKQNIKSYIKDAHFAIVLDYNKLKTSEFVKKQDIKIERDELKQGALSFKSDAEIKKQNIDRYIKQLSTNLDIHTDISNLERIIKRLLGYKNAIYHIYKGNTKDYISNIISEYIRIMKSNEEDKEYYIKQLSDYISGYFKSTMTRNSNINDNLKNLKKILSEDGDRDKEIKILSLIQQLSDVSYDLLMGHKIETIEDLEVVYQKLVGVKNVITTNRYAVRQLGYFLQELVVTPSNRTNDRVYDYLTNHYYVREKNSIIDGLETAIKIVSRM